MDHQEPFEDLPSKATLERVKLRWGERLNIPRIPGTRIIFKDMYSTNEKGRWPYEWLEPGWILEERHMPGGRVYRYYYDPSGFKYNKKCDVEETLRCRQEIRHPLPHLLMLQ